MSEVRTFLKVARQVCHLSQQELADMVGTTRATICELERGRRSLRSPAAKAVAELLHVPVEKLFEEVSDERDRAN